MKLERSEEILKKNPLPPELPSSLFGPSSKWLVYSKQDEALHVAKELDLMTFSFEERVPGSEGRYVVLQILLLSEANCSIIYFQTKISGYPSRQFVAETHFLACN